MDSCALCYSSQKRQEGACNYVWRIAIRVLAGLLIAIVLLYLGDWAVWRVRVGTGGGMGTAQVSRFVVAPLKGNKEEYYFDGMATVDCSRSLFPQAGSGACWWIERHRVVYER
ncbi:MAG TPA: hypothetical protein VK578_01010 [Edaphobacter sp.]|nr:hypothetical protein [Edaphobacter sp.]